MIMEKEINIKKIWGTIRKRIWVVFVFSFIFSIAAGVYSYYFTTPEYSSSIKIVLNVAEGEIGTLNQLLKEPIVLRHVIDELDLKASPENLSGQITITPVNDSKIYEITVVANDPKLAARIADSVARVYQREFANLIELTSGNDVSIDETETDTTLSPGNINILSEAKENPGPNNQNHKRFIMIGFIFGVIVGLGLVFLLDSLDDTVKSHREIEHLLGIPVLGSISRISNKSTQLRRRKQQGTNLRGETLESSTSKQ
ncbi:YveK family protein [Bacillus yapensis]|nr:Wzz/FepE/Etk N-terminal domain-containing protein [Bacillus yapensis]